MAYKWMSDENFLESEPVGSRDQTQVIRLPLQVLELTEPPQLAHNHHCIQAILPKPETTNAYKLFFLSHSLPFLFYVVSSSGYLFHNYRNSFILLH